MNRAEAFRELARERRSVRTFRDDSIPDDLVLRVVEAARWAPSAGNRQDWQFTIVTSRSVKEQMSQVVQARWRTLLAEADLGAATEEVARYARNFDWFANAPVLIAVCAKKPESFLCHMLGEAAADVAGAKVSAAMAAQNLMLAAHAEGLGSCCLTGPLAAPGGLRELLGIGGRREIVCLIALGFAAERPSAPPRKPVEKIVRYVR